MQKEIAEKGQSLIEILVASALGALLVGAAATLIAPALRISTQTSRVQVGAVLAQELLDNARVWSEGDWHNLANLATSSANIYHLVTATSPFVFASGSEAIILSTTTYTRYFYVDDVFRDAGGNITTAGGGTWDPSTKKVTVICNWSGAASATTTLYAYFTRHRDFVLDQTDWTGGPNQAGPVTSTNNMFATSSNVGYTTTTGSIYINLPGY